MIKEIILPIELHKSLELKRKLWEKGIYVPIKGWLFQY